MSRLDFRTLTFHLPSSAMFMRDLERKLGFKDFVRGESIKFFDARNKNLSYHSLKISVATELLSKESSHSNQQNF